MTIVPLESNGATGSANLPISLFFDSIRQWPRQTRQTAASSLAVVQRSDSLSSVLQAHEPQYGVRRNHSEFDAQVLEQFSGVGVPEVGNRNGVGASGYSAQQANGPKRDRGN